MSQASIPMIQLGHCRTLNAGEQSVERKTQRGKCMIPKGTASNIIRVQDMFRKVCLEKYTEV